MGFEKLKFKVEPIRFDYLFDESLVDFGEHGYSLVGILGFLSIRMVIWDYRLISKFIDYPDDYKPFVQDLFPESARNKLSSFRNYTEDQLEFIEGCYGNDYHEG